MQHGDVVTQLQSALSHYANHPAFLHWNGKPVIFFWSPQSLGNAAAWRAVRSKVDPGNSQIWSVDTTDCIVPGRVRHDPPFQRRQMERQHRRGASGRPVARHHRRL